MISSLIEHETELQPLASAIAAFGHLDNPLAIPLIIRYQTHPSEKIRFQVACALGSFPNDPKSVRTRLMLMEDNDEDVRDWATFGLGSQSDSDSTDIRDALIHRLGDSDKDVREEAITGLAKRQDQRVLLPLLEALERPPVASIVIEAAHQMLGMENDRKDWGPGEYAVALQQRFGM